MQLDVVSRDDAAVTGTLELSRDAAKMLTRAPLRPGTALKIYNERPAGPKHGRIVYFSVIPGSHVGNAVVIEGDFGEGDVLSIKAVRN